PVDLALEERPTAPPVEGELDQLVWPIAIHPGPLFGAGRGVGAVPVDEAGGEVPRPPPDPNDPGQECGKDQPGGPSLQGVPPPFIPGRPVRPGLDHPPTKGLTNQGLRAGGVQGKPIVERGFHPDGSVASPGTTNSTSVPLPGRSASPSAHQRPRPAPEIGRASCRARV